MINEKDIRRFTYGDKYLKQLLKPQLEEEVNNLNLWLPDYERYYNLNPKDTPIGSLIQEGREKLKTLEALLLKTRVE